MVKAAHYFLCFALACLLTAVPLYLAVISPLSSADLTLNNNGASSIDWSSLKGVNYIWSSLGIEDGSLTPATTFPTIAGFGWDLIRVPVSWQAYLANPSSYTGYLQQVASQANSNGIYVIYDFHAGGTYNTGKAFPSSLLSQYSDDNTFYAAWWTNQVNFNGQTGWSAIWNTFWKPLVQAVDSQSSTLGYEIMNEPPMVSGMTSANMQQYNTYIAQQIRTISSKTIVFMGPYSCVGCGKITGSAPILSVAPTGTSNIAIDAHEYSSSSISSDFSAWQTASQQLGGIPVWIGEWAVCNGCTMSQSQAQSTIQSYENAFHQYNFANTYWMWSCGTTQINLLDSSCQTYWIDTLIQQAQGSTVMSSSTKQTSTSVSTTSSFTSSITTTKSTLSTSTTQSSTTSYSSITASTTLSKISSTLTTTSSQISSTSSSTSSSSSSASLTQPNTSTVSSFSQNAVSSTSTSLSSSYSSTTQTHTNNGNHSGQNKRNSLSSTTDSTVSSNPIVGLLSMLSQSKDPPLAFGFASYEIALVFGLPLALWTARKNDYDGGKNISGWRW